MFENHSGIMTIADFEINNMTDDIKRALETHERIIAAEQTAATAMLSLCENLKKMRDTQLYKELGFDKFEEYSEKACNIKKRQAYNYISTYEKLGKGFLQSNADLGITKLQLLTEVCAVDRAEFVEENDLGGMSVAEIKKIIEQNKQRGEQLSVLSDELETVKTDATNAKIHSDTAIEQMKAEIEELRNRPTEADIAKAVEKKTEEFRKQLEKEKKEKIKEVKKQAQADMLKRLQKEFDEKKASARLEVEQELEEKIKLAEAEKEQALQRAEELANRLDKNADADLVTASIYFGEVQKTLNSFLQSAAKVESNDIEKGRKLKALAADFLKKAIDELN